MSFWRVVVGDALERLAELDDQTVQTCVTSPPYFGLRDYGADDQVGLEATPDEYVARLVGVFREVRRVLRDDGTLWLNLGDSYASGGSGGASPASTLGGGGGRYRDGSKAEAQHLNGFTRSAPAGCKPKDLLGIPWMVAFALRADGWYLRSDIVWAKPNPMPESVTDRPTKAHEYVFLLSKSPRYFYDADAVREDDSGRDGRNVKMAEAEGVVLGRKTNPNGGLQEMWYAGAGRNKRSVWTVATQPFPGAHFAVFPPKLIEPCVLAGSAEDAGGVCGAPWERVVEHGEVMSTGGSATGARASNMEAVSPLGQDPDSGAFNTGAFVQREHITKGFVPSCSCSCPDCDRETGHREGCPGPPTGTSTVLDPFAGAGTTGLVATRLGRSFIGIELNPEYAEMARERIRDDAPLMNYLIEDEEVSPHA